MLIELFLIFLLSSPPFFTIKSKKTKKKMLIVKSLLILFFTSTTLFSSQYVIVDLSEQMAYAMEDGAVIFEGRISSGKRGHETPEGDFSILQKKRHHTSNLWPKPRGGAKMPYMMRLTNTGIAMHSGYVPNRAASHGCIRLKKSFAIEMFNWIKVGTRVYVEGDASYYGKEYDNYYDDYAVVD